MSVTLNKPAPDFSATTDQGALSLKSLRGQYVLLYFYPKDDTPGCTIEACSFQDNLPHFEKLNTVIIGVSPDNEKSHAKFRAKFGLKFHLAADTEQKIAAAYGTWVQKSMYGKQYMGMERSSFLIGPDGVIKAIWRKIDPKTHVEEVLAALSGTEKKEKKTASAAVKKTASVAVKKTASVAVKKNSPSKPKAKAAQKTIKKAAAKLTTKKAAATKVKTQSVAKKKLDKKKPKKK